MRAAPLAAPWLVALLSAPALASAAAELRVLLFESQGVVEVAGARIRPAGEGLEVDGRQAKPRWKAPGPGPHQAGPFQVRGALWVEREGAGLRVINQVPLESYLAGTLGREIYSSWSAAALRAQAVVSRTYALYQSARRGQRSFDLSADTRHQVYGGLSAENEAVRRAVSETRSEVLTWRGKPILAAFHSASGGQTASAEEVWGQQLPYLRSVSVEGEEKSPDTYWRTSVPKTKLARALAPLGFELGEVREARVAERSASGRAINVEIGGSRATAKLSARTLRQTLGAQVLRSTLFQIRDTGDALSFVGSGHGHGVGMSQWGAQAMAERGASHAEILAAFYPGAELVQWEAR